MKEAKAIITERIGKLLDEKNVKQKELAKILGITDNTVSYYVSGKRTPNIDQIIKIANYFNISTDYLLGLTPVETNNVDLKKICEYTGLTEKSVERLRQFENGIYSAFKVTQFINSFIENDCVALISRSVQVAKKLSETIEIHGAPLKFKSKDALKQYSEKLQIIKKELFDLCGDYFGVMSADEKINFEIYNIQQTFINFIYSILPDIKESDKIQDEENTYITKEELAEFLSIGKYEEDGSEFINKNCVPPIEQRANKEEM